MSPDPAESFWPIAKSLKFLNPLSNPSFFNGSLPRGQWSLRTLAAWCTNLQNRRKGTGGGGFTPICNAATHFSPCLSRFFLLQNSEALPPMKTSLFLALFLTVASAFAVDVMKFVSPDNSSTLLVDKSGRRDIIELKSGKRVHRLFYEDLDEIFKAKIAEAFNASLNKVGKIVLPTFTSARWTSADEVEIKGESVVNINDDDGDEFTFTAAVSKSGNVNYLTIVPNKS